MKSLVRWDAGNIYHYSRSKTRDMNQRYVIVKQYTPFIRFDGTVIGSEKAKRTKISRRITF